MKTKRSAWNVSFHEAVETPSEYICKKLALLAICWDFLEMLWMFVIPKGIPVDILTQLWWKHTGMWNDYVVFCFWNAWLNPLERRQDRNVFESEENGESLLPVWFIRPELRQLITSGRFLWLNRDTYVVIRLGVWRTSSMNVISFPKRIERIEKSPIHFYLWDNDFYTDTATLKRWKGTFLWLKNGSIGRINNKRLLWPKT